MSVPTFFTGLRVEIAALVAFQLLAHFSLSAISWLGRSLQRERCC